DSNELRLVDSAASIERSLLEPRDYALSTNRADVDVRNTTMQFAVPSDVPNSINFFHDSVVAFNHVTATTAGSSDFHGASRLSVSNSFLRWCRLLDDSELVLDTGNLHHGSPGSANCLGLVAADHGLLPLADNGGPTRTRAIGNPNSAAINAGDPAHCEALDQRGEVRSANCDVGAFEVSESADVSVLGDIDPGGSFGSSQQVTYFAEIANNGPGPASLVEIDLDVGGVLVTAIDSAFCPAFPCVVTRIEAGQTLVIPVEMTLFSHLSGPCSTELSAHSTANSTYD